MLSSLCRRFAPAAARQLRAPARNSSGHHAPTTTMPGENLPFDIDNKYKLTALFIVFFGSGLAIPFLAVRHQLLKNK